MAENIALKTRKSNKKFMVLSAIGIIMVVDAHSWTSLNLFASHIPYNSFFMPMFVFISGYFNKVGSETDLRSYIVKKIRKLLLPYLAFSLSLMVVEQLINLILRGGIKYDFHEDVLRSLVGIIIGIPYSIASPLWFVYSLFLVQITYAVIKKLLCRHWNSYVMFTIFCLFNMGSVYIVKTFEPGILWAILLKCLFFISFIELGIIFREKIEPALSSLKKGWNVVLLLALLIINSLRITFLSDPYFLTFPAQYLDEFPSPYVITPLISSFIGILFWVTVAETIGEAFRDNKAVNYMSENTYWIMGLHVLFFDILNCILLFINNFIYPLPDFSYSEISWSYFWYPVEQFRILYLAFGLTGPLLIRFLFGRMSSRVAQLRGRK